MLPLSCFGSGPVKGFAVTLIIGILTSMFTAVMVTRLLIVDLAAPRAAASSCRSEGAACSRGIHLIPHDTSINFMRWHKVTFAFSVIMVVGSILLIAIRGSITASISPAAS